MQFLFLLLSLFMPFLQPVVQHGADKMHRKLGIPQQPSQQPAQPPMLQPMPAQAPIPQYHFDGIRWYKYENGQVYVWNGNGPPQF